MDCEHCDDSFSNEAARLRHVLDAHQDDITSHKRDQLKRQLNKLESQEDSSGLPYRKIGVIAAALILFVGGGYALVQTGIISVDRTGNSTGALGPAGSAHEHAQFTVTINGDRVNFAKPQYQVGGTQNSYAHFEGGDGVTIHKHATGVSIGYTLESVGFSIEENCLHTPQNSNWAGQDYCEPDGSLSIQANGRDVTKDYVIMDGDTISITYAGS